MYTKGLTSIGKGPKTVLAPKLLSVSPGFSASLHPLILHRQCIHPAQIHLPVKCFQTLLFPVRYKFLMPHS